MASDNLMSGVAGFAEGLQNVLVPYMQMQQKAKIQSALDAQKSAESKISVKELKAITGQSFPGLADTDLIDKALVPYFTKQELGTTNVYGPHGESLGQVKGGVTQLKDENGPGSQRAANQQDKLEKDYRDLLDRAVQRGSGGLGQQDQKVNQAIHMRNLLDQYYDPKTGQYSVPKSQYEELAIGLANLISGSGQATESMRQGIIQRTAKGDINGALGYITGTTPSASTNAVFKNISDSVDRQGMVSEQLRDKYLDTFRGQAPTGLSPDRVKYLNKTAFASSYRDYLNQSPTQGGSAQGTITPLGNSAGPDHNAALDWAKANPSDPRAAKIIKAQAGLGILK